VTAEPVVQTDRAIDGMTPAKSVVSIAALRFQSIPERKRRGIDVEILKIIIGNGLCHA
jgi:hypothetical protein